MIIYGASGHGKVIIDSLESMGESQFQIWDDGDVIDTLYGMQVTKPFPENMQHDKAIIAIGTNSVRKRIAENIKHKIEFGLAIHTAAVISRTARILEGTVIMSHVSINADTLIGRHCIVNTNASVDHDCILGDYTHISPNVALSGNVSVGEGSHIGTGSAVIQGIKIGKWTTVGAGSTIINDIPDYAVVVGTPGKIIKYNSFI